MWISEIKIQNFRPFYSEVVVKFDQDSQEKLTIIEAKADTGKTTFLSAIAWCLYGNEVKNIREDVHDEYLHPFNLTRKDELRDGDHETMSVEISLNEKGDEYPSYVISRNAQIRKSGNDVEYIGDPTFKIQEWENNNARSMKPEEAERVRDTILPEDIHLFFLFEGEKLEKHFSFYSKDSIEQAIEKVSQINQIDNGMEHLHHVRDVLYAEDKGGQDDEYERNQAEINRLQDGIKETKKNLEVYEGEIATALSKKEEIDRKLSEVNIPLIQELNGKRKDLERTNDGLEKELVQTKQLLLDKLLSDAPLAISINAVTNLLGEIDKADKNKELPPKIKQLYLRELLEKKMCICSRSLDPKDKAAIGSIEEIKNRLKEEDLSDMSEVLIEGRYKLSDTLEKMKHRFKNERDSLLSKATNLENTIKNNKAAIELIDQKLKDTDEQDVIAQQEERKNLEAAILKQNSTVARLKASVNIKEEEISDKRKRNDQLAKKKKGYEQKKRVADFLDRALAHLDTIKMEIVNEVRQRVVKKTFESFQTLHWDKHSYSNFSIDSSYQMSLKDSNDNEKIYNISSGTKQVLLLSFIAALVDVSGFKFPIFIDTPLANTDNEQRENIATNLPSYLKGNQVVLLMKDQEYTPVFKKIIKNSVCQEMRFIKRQGKTEVSK